MSSTFPFPSEFDQRSINSVQGHHAQSVNDIPVGMFHQPENTRPTYQMSQQQYYQSLGQSRPSQNRDDVEMPSSYYGTVPISEKYNPTSTVPQQPQFSNAAEGVNGPKDPNSTTVSLPVKRKRGRPALFPSGDNGSFSFYRIISYYITCLLEIYALFP